MIKIVVDLLGADKPQTELVLGAIRAISENKDLYVYLMGRKAELEDFLANVTYDESQLEIVGGLFFAQKLTISGRLKVASTL